MVRRQDLLQDETTCSTSDRPQMRIAPLIEFFVGITHRLWLAAAEHDLEVDRLQAVILVPMDDAGRARYAFPRTQPLGDTLARLVLDEYVEMTLQNEENLLDLMGMSRVTLARRHKHDRKGEVLGRNGVGIAVLAGAASTDKAVLRPPEALDLGVFKRRPVRLTIGKPRRIALHDVFQRHTNQLCRKRMSCDAHELLLRCQMLGLYSKPEPVKYSDKSSGGKKVLNELVIACGETPSTLDVRLQTGNAGRKRRAFHATR
jgi:hypothetical protein